jgi:hypothetical protein
VFSTEVRHSKTKDVFLVDKTKTIVVATEAGMREIRENTHHVSKKDLEIVREPPISCFHNRNNNNVFLSGGGRAHPCFRPPAPAPSHSHSYDSVL